MFLFLHKQTNVVVSLLAADTNGPTDDHCVISLMHGLCFKSVGNIEEATRCFEDVIAK